MSSSSPMPPIRPALLATLALAGLASSAGAQADPTLILDAREVQPLSSPVAHLDAPDGSLVVTGGSGDVMRVAADGSTTRLVTAVGDRWAQPLLGAVDAVMDASGRVFVGGSVSENVFRVETDDTLTVLVPSGAIGPVEDLELDALGDLYVAGGASADTVHRVASDGTATLVLGAGGVPGGTATLSEPRLRRGPAGEVFVLSATGAVFLVQAGGAAQEFAPGTGGPALDVQFDGAGAVHLLRRDGVYRREANGTWTWLYRTVSPESSTAMTVGDSGTVWVSSFRNVATTTPGISMVRVTPQGVAATLFDPTTFGGLAKVAAMAHDSAGAVFFHREGGGSGSLFRVDAAGVVTAVSSTGDVSGATTFAGPPRLPRVAAADHVRFVYSNAVVRLAPDGTETVLLDHTSNGIAMFPTFTGVALGGDGSSYVPGRIDGPGQPATDPGTVLRVASDGTVTQLGQTAAQFSRMVVDDAGRVFAMGAAAVHRIDPDGTTTQVLGNQGDGNGNLYGPGNAIAIDPAGDVYASSSATDNVFRVDPSGAVAEVLDASTKGSGYALQDPRDLAVDAFGDLYVLGFTSRNVLKLSTTGVVSQVLGPAGDGQTAVLSPTHLAVAADGTVFVTTSGPGDTVFRVRPNGAVDVLAGGLVPNGLAVDPFGSLYAVEPFAAGANVGRVLRIDGGAQQTVAFQELAGSVPGSPPWVETPWAVAVDAQSRFYLAGLDSGTLQRFDGPPTWPDLGGAVNGSAGPPRLAMRGPLTGGSALDRTLDDVPPDTLMLAWIATQSTPFPHLGGTVHAYPFLVQLLFASNSLGSSSLSVTWPTGFPSGVDVYVQFVVQDFGVPGGIGLSNAVMSTTP